MYIEDLNTTHRPTGQVILTDTTEEMVELLRSSHPDNDEVVAEFRRTIWGRRPRFHSEFLTARQVRVEFGTEALDQLGVAEG